MNVNVYIPTRLLTLIEEQFAARGIKLSNDQLRRFFENDIIEVYDNHISDDLASAIDCFPV